MQKITLIHASGSVWNCYLVSETETTYNVQLLDGGNYELPKDRYTLLNS